MNEAVDRTQADDGRTIAGRRVGPGTPAFVIAEAGVNHNGSIESALSLADAARRAGADAVKFQLFHSADLVGPSAPTADYQRRRACETSQRAMLQRLELPAAAWAKIKTRCDRVGITFLATPFGLRELEALRNLGVPALKIASTDLTNTPLIEAAIDAGLPTILSTGASTVEELRFAVDLFRRAGAMPRLILLHCVSCYPTPPDRLNLAAVATLRKTFGVPCGLSDHSTSTQTGAWAVAAGAFVVEKHLTLDPALDGPDHALSLNPEQFAEYVAQIRSCEQTLGDGRLGMQELERNVRLTASRSIVSSCDIPIGTVLTRDLLTLKRPGTGLGPTELSRLVGRRAATDIPADTVFSWDMVT